MVYLTEQVAKFVAQAFPNASYDEGLRIFEALMKFVDEYPDMAERLNGWQLMEYAGVTYNPEG